MSNIDKRSYRADGGDISTGRLKEIADNPYGDEEKCWLAKRVLALLDELEDKNREISVWRKRCENAEKGSDLLQRRNAELEARKVRVNLPRPGFMTTGNHGFAKNDVLAALREAGIKLEVG
ncbi:hypothetical protein [Enterobacter asburiae]|uniref:hypothetical protein n=1 Tax=Enterobacter asburiae TaxID=61645 RepID=UPI0015EA2154|nr:hypothetical protein [Enterobacter asburiae]QLY64899.1 hypothetical protein HV228_09040 [Enterobacter asburiae]